MKRLFYNLLLLVGIATVMSSCGYNSMVEKEMAVKGQWAQVENVYQRRANLIPNLVKTVKAEADFQKSTLTEVMKARAEATSIKLNVDQLTPENIQKFQQVQDGLSSALNRLMVVSENYPTLDTKGFQNLRDQLEGSENRITVEIRRFNEVVQDYNTYIKKFPNNLTSGMFGFKEKGFFTAKPGADEVPSVDFN